MVSMNVFRGSAFNTISLSSQSEKIDYKPQYLGGLGIFDVNPVRVHDIFVDRRDGVISLVPTSELGAPPEQLTRDNRSAKALKVTRLAKGFTLRAQELSGIRAYGNETELMQVQAEYLRRSARVRDDIELTEENHRLGALQGKLLDADGSTVIYDFFTEFGITEASAINFALDTSTTIVKNVCASVVRAMVRSAKGAFTSSTRIHSLCGDSFWDKLTTHPNVEKFYLNHVAANALKDVGPFESFTFGGITFHNYRGTDDNSTVAIPTTQAKFFPVGAREVFSKAQAPAEFDPFINTLGRSIYAMALPDPSGRNAFVSGEQYAYPLYYCQRPEVLRKAVEA